MGNVAAKMQELRQAGKKALMPFLTAGFPSPSEFPALLGEVSQIADVVEVGVPFSDPLADGPVIQYTSQVALERGVTLPSILETLSGLRAGAPLVLMSYLNPLLRFSSDGVFKKVRDAGISGMIISDLPVEEGESYERDAAAHDLDLVYLLTPTTGGSRARLITERSGGFVYLVSITGVTGARDRFSDEMIEFLARIRKLTDKPLCVGFGISKPEHVAQVAPYVDGVIVGSALLRVMMENPGDYIGKAREFLLELKGAGL
jgi:tryptophan synthase alpha chain